MLAAASILSSYSAAAVDYTLLRAAHDSMQLCRAVHDPTITIE